MIPLEQFILEKSLGRATTAARIVGHPDDYRDNAFVGLLTDHVDAIAHELNELLDDPRPFSLPALSKRSVLVLARPAGRVFRAGGDR